MPTLERTGALAVQPRLAPAVASLTLCKSVAEAKRKGRPATVHGYCIEAYKDGRRTVHPVF